jgi:ribose transport system ATP-binding protein
MTDLLLEATGIAKRYGAVTALRNASLSVRPGEVHALMGANGAGKSTLVKILTGAARPDSGTILVRGKARDLHSPTAARRSGVVSVYQEPALIPDLDIESNLRLTNTPRACSVRSPPSWASPTWTWAHFPREMPLAVVRIVDLARALALEPDILLLDEMTAALPADLTERVLDVVGRQRATGRSVIFISHRLLEIAAVCDRATVLRDGETVGTVDMAAGAEDRIVDLMLGPGGGAVDTPRGARSASTRAHETPQLEVRGISVGTKLNDVSFSLHAGEVLGLVALEGQGQDELFGVLAGSIRPDAGEVLVDGARSVSAIPPTRSAPASCSCPANRAEALLGQRSVRENIALPRRPGGTWGPIHVRQEKQAVDGRSRASRSIPAPRPKSGGSPAATSRRSPSRAGSPAASRPCPVRSDPRHRYPDEARDLPARP